MAPTKTTRALGKQNANATTVNALPTLMPLARKALTRRSANTINNNIDQNIEIMQTRGKRKAEHSPVKNDKVKRSALGNLTNNVKIITQHPDEGDKQLNKKKELPKVQVLKDTQYKNAAAAVAVGQQMLQQQQQQQQQVHKIATRASTRNAKQHQHHDDQTEKIAAEISNAAAAAASVMKAAVVPEPTAPPAAPMAAPNHLVMKSQPTKPMRRISNEFNKTEESLYMSALEDSTSESMRLSGNFEAARRRSAAAQQQQQQQQLEEQQQKTDESAIVATSDECGEKYVEHIVPDGVEDFDKANWNDPFQVSHYAMDIFNYLRERESQFIIHDYMDSQVHLSKWMRSLLVDWMVEVQETFELNHETLYLAVKIVDLYLCRVIIQKDKLQLLGAAALFIACKFDERTPPLIDDFLYICDGAYKQDELIQMEMKTLRTIDYDLGIPLSYRFLRRYARCAKVPMPTLTLARYILEMSLMDYATVGLSDSQLAAAVLYMALRMHGADQPWTSTMEYYTSYKLEDFADIVVVLNVGLFRKPKGTIKTIRSKYSHKIFHEVAKVPLMSTEKLFENNLPFKYNEVAESGVASNNNNNNNNNHMDSDSNI